MDVLDKLMFVVTGIIGTFLGVIIIALICMGVQYAWVVHKEGYVEHGTIVEKNYNPAHTSMVMAGKVFVPIHHPESWSFLIYGPHQKSGRNDTRTIPISEGEFEQKQIGDKYP